MSDTPTKSILEQGLAEAQKLALLPPNATLAMMAVKDGDVLRGGIVTRLHDQWQLAGELNVNLDSKAIGGSVAIIFTNEKGR